MNTKVAGLAAIAVMATALLFQIDSSNQGRSNQLLLPGLKEVLNDIDQLSISKADNKITMVRTDSTWLVREAADHPADFELLSGFLLNLATLEIAENKTARPENHARLDVADEGEGAGVRVRVSPGDFAVIVGSHSGSRGTFVRYADDPQVFLTDGTIEASTIAMDWIDPVVINVDAENVAEVTIATRAAEFLSVTRDPETGDTLVRDLPAGRELRYGTIADSLPRLLVNVRATGVAPYDASLFSDPSTARFQLLSGETIVVSTVTLEESFWMHIDRDDLQAWQYQVSEHTFKEFNKTMEDLLQPLDDDNE